MPAELREAQKNIQGSMTKFQQNLKVLESHRDDIGTDEDNYEFRQALLGK